MSCSTDEKMRREIAKKNNQTRAYYATNNTVKEFTTDFDNFPYIRWYRGRYEIPEPEIIDREAGYRKAVECVPVAQSATRDVVENYYVGGNPSKGDLTSSRCRDIPRTGPGHGMCYENACSTVLPCRKSQLDYKEAKIASTDASVVISP